MVFLHLNCLMKCASLMKSLRGEITSWWNRHAVKSVFDGLWKGFCEGKILFDLLCRGRQSLPCLKGGGPRKRWRDLTHVPFFNEIALRWNRFAVKSFLIYCRRNLKTKQTFFRFVAFFRVLNLTVRNCEYHIPYLASNFSEQLNEFEHCERWHKRGKTRKNKTSKLKIEHISIGFAPARPFGVRGIGTPVVLVLLAPKVHSHHTLWNRFAVKSVFDGLL